LINFSLNKGGLRSRYLSRPVMMYYAYDYTREAMIASAKKNPMIAETGTDWNYFGSRVLLY